ncbi:hypothetical protein [Pseudazoarcus pumilus]|uniref:Uncharacterized protein n=1 Tax=Pseudazoarcus pumilus TaxID=2067960 RepID=A0A2I6S866_9RHOO|nr:hypothetical protein [Pseudazoarcus pumilus]AUN95432.1 hypothetical protein C0099_11130 [Pseudazoarcus pumilus]
MNTIATHRALRAVKHVARIVPIEPQPDTPPEFGAREIERHVQAVITENDFRPEPMVRSHRAKLAAALRYLGERWIGHPARRLGRQVHEHRDGIVASVSLALGTPVVLAHSMGWLA